MQHWGPIKGPAVGRVGDGWGSRRRACVCLKGGGGVGSRPHFLPSKVRHPIAVLDIAKVGLVLGCTCD